MSAVLTRYWETNELADISDRFSYKHYGIQLRSSKLVRFCLFVRMSLLCCCLTKWMRAARTFSSGSSLFHSSHLCFAFIIKIVRNTARSGASWNGLAARWRVSILCLAVYSWFFFLLNNYGFCALALYTYFQKDKSVLILLRTSVFFKTSDLWHFSLTHQAVIYQLHFY